MEIKVIQKEFNGNFLELHKIVNSWNLIPGSSKDEFDFLTNKILNQLYKNADSEKIDRILQSDLIVNYGLFGDEFNSENLTNEIISWWNNK